MTVDEITVGVLACQGAFLEHILQLNAVKKLLSERQDDGICYSLKSELIKKPSQLNDSIHGLIIPGGESTTMAKFLQRNGLRDAICKWKDEYNRPIFGTCAGLILMSDQLTHQKEGGQVNLGGVAITTDRNFYGRQQESHESPILLSDELAANGKKESVGVYIRAPGITSIDDSSVSVLANDKVSGKPVAVRQRSIMLTEFHPELTDDCRWHQYFVKMITESRNK